jgi:anti-sigma regulatory factor (Ser/Thr protein kinase)
LIRAFVRTKGAAAGVDAASLDELVLATSEAASNAVLHANATLIRVSWSEEGDRAVVVVHDDGIFVRRVGRPGGDGGRGTDLMIALVDEISVREGTPSRPGTEVRLVKCRDTVRSVRHGR